MVFALVIVSLIALLEAGLCAYVFHSLVHLHKQLMDRFMAKNFGEYKANTERREDIPQADDEEEEKARIAKLKEFEDDWAPEAGLKNG